MQQWCFGNIYPLRRLGKETFKIRVLLELSHIWKWFCAVCGISEYPKKQKFTGNFHIKHSSLKTSGTRWKNQQPNKDCKDIYFGFKYLEWQLKHPDNFLDLHLSGHHSFQTRKELDLGVMGPFQQFNYVPDACGVTQRQIKENTQSWITYVRQETYAKVCYKVFSKSKQQSVEMRVWNSSIYASCQNFL